MIPAIVTGDQKKQFEISVSPESYQEAHYSAFFKTRIRNTFKLAKIFLADQM
jgi:hypothetical protein